MKMKQMENFKSYAFQNFSRKKIQKLSEQYKGIDMVYLMELNHPELHICLIKGKDQPNIILFHESEGPKTVLDEDCVRSYATIEFIKENGYPIFNTWSEADEWAKENGWPVKALPPQEEI